MTEYDFKARALLSALHERMPLVSWQVMLWRDVYARNLVRGDCREDVIHVTGLLKVGWGTLKFKEKLEVSLELLGDRGADAVEDIARRFVSNLGEALLNFDPESVEGWD